jgi:hypothetical protein
MVVHGRQNDVARIPYEMKDSGTGMFREPAALGELRVIIEYDRRNNERLTVEAGGLPYIYEMQAENLCDASKNRVHPDGAGLVMGRNDRAIIHVQPFLCRVRTAALTTMSHELPYAKPPAL